MPIPKTAEEAQALCKILHERFKCQCADPSNPCDVILKIKTLFEDKLRE